MARPTKYSKKLADEFCKRIKQGNSIRSVCLADDMPSKTTIIEWLDNKKQFLDQLTRAKEIRSELMLDEIIDIAEDGSNDWYEKEVRKDFFVEVPDHEHIQRSKLRCDIRFRLHELEKLKKDRGDNKGIDLPSVIVNVIPKSNEDIDIK